ncbi:MAG: condensation domain-containing protein, partial [Arcicella sp.]|nr:condensation domain-containing protein [Arcicella sp.]
RIHQQLGVKLGVEELFKHTTIEKLVLALESKTRGHYESIPTHIPPQAYYPLSSSQTRLWVAHQLQKNKEVFNINGVFELKGELDMDALNKAFVAIATRHESLRTTFIQVNDTPFQKINPIENVDFKVIKEDLLHIEDNYNDSIVSEIIETFTIKPFELSSELPFRVKVVQFAGNQFLLMVSMHHIISDEWSLQIMAREFMELYGHYIHRRAIELPILTLQSKECTQWLLKQEQNEEYKEISKFWVNEFKDWNLLPSIRHDFQKPNVASGNGDSISIQLSLNVTTKLREISKKQGGLFITLLTSLKTLLFHENKQNDIVIGTPVSGRIHKDLENQIGFYVNDIAIRTRYSEKDSFLSYGQRVKNKVLELYKYQHYPFPLVLETLSNTFNKHYPRLFDVGFTWHEKFSFDKMNAEGIDINQRSIASKTSKNDIWFHGYDEGNSLRIVIEYNTDIFEETTIWILSKRLNSLLEQVTENPSIILSNLRLTIEEEMMSEQDLFDMDFSF